MVSTLKHTQRVLDAYLRDGEEGLSRVADHLHEEAHSRPGGKFGKREADYLPQTPLPPTLWRTSCERCRFWQEGAPGEPGRCHIVGRPDDPYGGEAIHPRAVCGVWMPPAGEPAFAWLRERFDPSGASTVRGEYRASIAERGIESGSDQREHEIPVTAEGRDDE